MLSFSERAQEAVLGFIDQGGEECVGLRIRAHRVGRTTFRYQIHLVREEDLEPTDFRLILGPVTVWLDPQTAEWMEGARLDYLELESGTGFEISNPQAEPDWQDPVCRRVQEVIDHQVLPVVGAHGGWVELDRVEGDTAYVSLGGGCQGCSSATFTLKEGIESVIVREVPEIRQVVDVTDHEAGEDPYLRG